MWRRRGFVARIALLDLVLGPGAVVLALLAVRGSGIVVARLFLYKGRGSAAIVRRLSSSLAIAVVSARWVVVVLGRLGIVRLLTILVLVIRVWVLLWLSLRRGLWSLLLWWYMPALLRLVAVLLIIGHSVEMKGACYEKLVVVQGQRSRITRGCWCRTRRA